MTRLPDSVATNDTPASASRTFRKASSSVDEFLGSSWGVGSALQERWSGFLTGVIGGFL